MQNTFQQSAIRDFIEKNIDSKQKCSEIKVSGGSYQFYLIHKSGSLMDKTNFG